jgi:hypothetical protein
MKQHLIVWRACAFVPLGRRRCRCLRLALQDERELINSLNADSDVVDARVGAAVKTLWADAGIQLAYENRAKFQLNDSAA